MLHFNTKSDTHWKILCQTVSSSSNICMSTFHAVTPCDSIAADRTVRCLSLNWHSIFQRALSRINNLLHNILVWTRGEIPADWNMWQGFDCVDPHFPFLPRSLPSPPAVCLLFPPSPSISPNPCLPLHTLQKSSHVGSQIQSWVGQTFLWHAQTCPHTKRMTQMGNSWWLSRSFYLDKWHNACRDDHGKCLTLYGIPLRYSVLAWCLGRMIYIFLL